MSKEGGVHSAIAAPRSAELPVTNSVKILQLLTAEVLGV